MMEEGEPTTDTPPIDQALATACEIGDKRSEGNALGNLGNAYKHLGDLVHAPQFGQQALEIFVAIEDPNAEKARKWLESLPNDE